MKKIGQFSEMHMSISFKFILIEYFQKRMHKALLWLERVICMMDDILVYGCDQEEHSSRLMAILEHLKQARVREMQFLNI